jgi:dipeptidyl aminopeptidase/acylaminoacyl peptidase
LAFVDTVDDTNIWRLPLSNGGTAAQAEPFISSAGGDDSPAYSPDGKKIVFVSDRSGKLELWLSDYDGTEVHQLTNFKGSGVGSPHWSPDGRRIVFDATLQSQSAVWLMNSDGSEMHRLNNTSATEYLPSWSRDGAWVYFVSARSGKGQLWKQRPESGEAVPVTQELLMDVVESPAGDYAYAERPHEGIWQIPLRGGKSTPIPGLEGVRPARYWTLQADKLYFVRQEQPPRDLEEFDLKTRKIRKLMQIPGELLVGTPGLTVDPAGGTLLFVQKSRNRSSIMLQER